MRALSEGQRVKVVAIDGVTIGAVGTVKRVCSDGSAWIALDERRTAANLHVTQFFLDTIHPFAETDPRATHMRAEPSDCEPVEGPKAGEVQKVTIEMFGKDHWSTFAYLTTLVNDGGRVDIRRMRCDRKRHPLLAATPEFGGVVMSRYDSPPTRLKNDELLHDHDDWDCVDDLTAVGLVENIGSHVNPVIRLTSEGLEVMRQITEHKQNGGVFANFTPGSPRSKPVTDETEGAA